MDMSHQHAMYFQTDLPIHIVFKGWMVSDTGALVGSCFGVLAISTVYEILKRLRVYFARIYRASHSLNNRVSPEDSDSKTAYFWKMHLLNSLTFLLQIFTGYILMLTVMTYNPWIFFSVVIGLVIGYLLGIYVAQVLGINAAISQGISKTHLEIETIEITVANKHAIDNQGNGGNTQTPARPGASDEYDF